MQPKFIPARLRALAQRLPAQWPEHAETCCEAAEEIQRLQGDLWELATFLRAARRDGDNYTVYIEVGSAVWLILEAAEAKKKR